MFLSIEKLSYSPSISIRKIVNVLISPIKFVCWPLRCSHNFIVTDVIDLRRYVSSTFKIIHFNWNTDSAGVNCKKSGIMKTRTKLILVLSLDTFNRFQDTMSTNQMAITTTPFGTIYMRTIYTWTCVVDPTSHLP